MLKTLLVKATFVAFVASVSFAAHAIADTQRFDVPAGDLIAALESFAKQADIDLVYQDEQVKGFRTGGVSGDFSPRDAVMKLLEGTPLQLRTDEASGALLITTPLPSGGPAPSAAENQPKDAAPQDSTAVREKRSFWDRFRLAQAGTNPSAQGDRAESRSTARDSSSRASAEAGKNRIVLDEIVVTGTHIRGAEVASRVLTITEEEMRLSGHNNLGEVIRALPQNFAGGQNPGVAVGASASSPGNLNVTGGSSMNLRGLGPDATLTLLNGARLPYDGTQQATDISVIPLAAINRVEILLDGASAIYGSDAVGGVANIILKRDYEGAELSARYGKATDGGFEQTQYTGVAGDTWDSGGFLVTGDVSRNTPVRAKDRDYLSYIPGQSDTIHPELSSKGALFSGYQQIGTFAELSLDTFYSERHQLTLLRATSISHTERDATMWGISPALRFELPGEWSVRLHGAYGRNETEGLTRVFSVATGLQTSQSRICFCNRAEVAGVEAEGPVFDLPGGEARLSIGGGFRKNMLESLNLITGATVIGGSDRSRYGYGEINLPLLTRFSVNVAARVEDYESFGERTTPRLGAIWTVAPGLDVKASWGKSFKVPTLSQQFTAGQIFLLSGPANGAPAGTTVLLESGGNPALDPERAEITTAGIVARPEFLPDFTLEFGWFDIDYTDRVVDPLRPFSTALSNPAVVEFVTLSPTVAEQNAAIAASSMFTNLAGTPYDPATVYAILHNRFANATAQHASGVDITARYNTEVLGGSLTASGNASWIDSTRNLTSLSPPFATTGVIYFPPKFKGRFGISWSREGVTLSSNVNHIGGVKNTNITPNPEGDSMTTFDLAIDYQTQIGALGSMGFNLAVTNLFNERPPFLQPLQTFFVNYDSTNYSAIGRVVSATVTKQF